MFIMTTAETNMRKQEPGNVAGAERTSTGKVFVPRVDIAETEDKICLCADLPGVDQDGIDITLEKNVLTIKGEVKPEVPEGYSLVYAEYDIGNFERAFTLSDEIDRDGIEATVNNGVLHLTLPKARHVLSRKISVKSSDGAGNGRESAQSGNAAGTHAAAGTTAG